MRGAEVRRIYIYTGNHNHYAGITDLVMMLRNGARDCGYDAVASHEPVAGQWNIFIENFTDQRQQQFIRSRWRPGTRYIVLCTEALTGRSFNDGLVSGHAHYGDGDYWQLRFEGFRSLLDLTDELWVLAQSQLGAYREAFPDKRVSLLSHGWVSGMATVEHRPESEKDLDFFFSGTLTPFRRRILEALGATHGVAISPQAGADYLRNDLLARAKVCLSIPLSAENRTPSVSRIHFHLQNSNFVLQHQYAESCDLDSFVLHAPAADFVDWARACLDIGNRREIACAASARFREEMPMTRFMGPLLADPPRGLVRAPFAGEAA